MGRVYKGRHDTLDRCAAIKTLLPKNAFDATARNRLIREARAQALLKHENIVGVYEFIPEPDGELFIAMEYVDGETLGSVLQRSPNARLTAGEAVPLIVQVLAALEHVHAGKIIHRDVKPSNVLVCNGVVKLTDFGIALIADAPRLTAHQHTVGTREYMSPEQLQGHDVDHRTDIYSAGLVLYTMLAGHPPFPARDIVAAVAERMAGPPDLRAVVTGLPSGIWDALCTALEFDAERRFRSAATFANALNDLAAGFLHPIPDPEEEIATEVLPLAAHADVETAAVPAETPRRSLVPWVMIAGSLTTAAYVLLHQRESFPVTAPAVTRARVVPLFPSIELTPALPAAPAPAPLPATRPAEGALPVIDTGRAEREAEERRRQEIARLRGQIADALANAEAALRDERFEAALAALDDAAQKAQQHPDDFRQERDSVRRLGTAVIEARVAADLRARQAALWEKRLTDVAGDLQQERWPEAERFAREILADADAPAAVVQRARALLQQARDGRIAALQEIQIGPTTNTTVRKPSTPPRRND